MHSTEFIIRKLVNMIEREYSRTMKLTPADKSVKKKKAPFRFSEQVNTQIYYFLSCRIQPKYHSISTDYQETNKVFQG